jgi:PTH1 family peptidyl-tRNA hydrolase
MFRRRDGRQRERRGTPADLLVVGLGNPGEDYAGTRHNMGADTVALLARRHGATLRRGKERSLAAEARIGDRLVALAVPLTYMNLSGEAVGMLARRYGVDDPGNVVIVHDELDLEPGRVKVKVGGGLGGHNGLKSIKQHLGTDEFVRVRIGVGKPAGRKQGADHVLRRPARSERDELAVAVEEAADAVELIVADGAATAMNQVNTRPPAP